VGENFAVTTSLDPCGEGRYRGEIDESWTLRPLPQGGIVTAIGLRAMATELDHPDQKLRSLHTTFIGQVAHGPVEVGVEVLRRGRSMSHLRAEAVNPGQPRGHLTTAVFGASRRGFEFTDLEPPSDVPPPESCPSFRDPLPPGVTFDQVPFWAEQIEGRAVAGHPPWEDYEPDRAEDVTWYRFDHSPMTAEGTMDPLALVVLADTMPGAVGEKVGRQDASWFAPSADLTVHLLGECRSPWVLAHNRARFAGDGYSSVDMALWDLGPAQTDEPRLVAYATQICFFTFLP